MVNQKLYSINIYYKNWFYLSTLNPLNSRNFTSIFYKIYLINKTTKGLMYKFVVEGSDLTERMWKIISVELRDNSYKEWFRIYKNL